VLYQRAADLGRRSHAQPSSAVMACNRGRTVRRQREGQGKTPQHLQRFMHDPNARVSAALLAERYLTAGAELAQAASARATDTAASCRSL